MGLWDYGTKAGRCFGSSVFRWSGQWAVVQQRDAVWGHTAYMGAVIVPGRGVANCAAISWMADLAAGYKPALRGGELAEQMLGAPRP